MVRIRRREPRLVAAGSHRSTPPRWRLIAIPAPPQRTEVEPHADHELAHAHPELVELTRADRADVAVVEEDEALDRTASPHERGELALARHQVLGVRTRQLVEHPRSIERTNAFLDDDATGSADELDRGLRAPDRPARRQREHQ